MPSRARLRLHAGLLAVQIVALAAMDGGLRKAWGFPIDDAWIHQVVARSFVEHGRLGFLPDRPSSGSSSLLFSLVLSIGAALHVDPVLFTAIVLGAAFLASGQLLLANALDDGADALEAFALASLTVLTGGFAWFALSGMEVLLFTALIFLAIRLWFGTRSAAWTGAALAALVLTRVDALALALLPLASVLLPALAERTPHRSRRDGVVASGIAAGAAAMNALLNVAIVGRPVPPTMTGRRWLYGIDDETLAAFVKNRMSSVAAWKGTLAHDVLCLWRESTSAQDIASSVVLLLALVGVYGWLRGPRARTSALAAAAVVHGATFLALMPVPGQAGRYQPLGIALALPAAADALRRIVARVSPAKSARFHASVAAIPVAIVALRSLFVFSSGAPDGIRHVATTHGAIATTILRDLPENEPVAAFDIGAIAYTTRRSIVDLGGLVDPGYLPYLKSGRAGAYLLERNVRYVVLPENPSAIPTAALPALADVEELRQRGIGLSLGVYRDLVLTKVAEGAAPDDVWPVSYLAMGHHSPKQTLYRIDGPR